jgi:ABC-type Na+ efflux pump permease subunit
MTEPPSIAGSIWTLARVTFARVRRGTLRRVAFAIAALPALAAVPLHGHGGLTLFHIVLVILPPLFIAPAIGEEIEERTGSYLWSRPIERWTIVAGKLLALAPMCAAFVALAAFAAGAAGDDAMRSPQVIAAVAAGALGSCAAVAGIATLLPRHAMIFAIVYQLVDAVFGGRDASLHFVTVDYATRSIAGATASSVMTGAIGLVAIAAVWLAVALARIARIET